MEQKYTVDTQDLYNLVMEGVEAMLNEVDFGDVSQADAEAIYQEAKKAKQLKELVIDRKKEIKAFLSDPKNVQLLNAIKNITPPPVK